MGLFFIFTRGFKGLTFLCSQLLKALVHGIPIHEAIGASIVSVIATSSGASIAYVKDKISNIKIGMFLETATTLGAVSGAIIAGLISIKALYITFSYAIFSFEYGKKTK